MKILVVDDHIILRKGLIKVLKAEYKNYEFIEASDGNNAISILTKDQDVVLVLSDLSMPNMNGIEMLKQIKSLQIKVPVIILTMHNEEQYAIRALKAGAYGFLNKKVDTTELTNAINKVLSGKKYVSDKILDLLSQSTLNMSVDNSIDTLSDREMEVFQLIAKGKTVLEIANEITLGVSTVSTYRTRILKKLNLKNNAEIVIFAVEHHLE